MKKLNKKGYVLVEIVLASALAFGLATYLITLIVKVKNKNSDLMVENAVMVDQGIVANMIMDYVYSNNITSCEDIPNLEISDNKVTFNGKTVFLSEYTNISNNICTTGYEDYLILTIPFSDTVGKSYDLELYINR